MQASVSVAVGDGVVRTSLLGTDQAVLVDTPSAPGDDYLLWEGKRFAIASEAITSALRIDDSTPLTVGTAFLQSLDAGTALDTPTIAGLGEPGPEIDGHPTQVGQLLRGDSNGEFSVVLADGVQSVNDLEAALLRTVHAPSELTVASNAIVSAKQSAKDGPALLDGAFHGLPAQLPTVADKPRELGDVCAVFTDDPDQQPRFAVAPSQLPNFEVTTVTESSDSAGGRADAVTVSPGHAALVRSGDRSPTVFAVAAPGRKYAFASPALLAAFGYGDQPAVLPGQLLPLIPDGKALDPEAARTPVSG